MGSPFEDQFNPPPPNYRFLPSFITLVTEYRIPSYASNQNCDETGNGKLDKDRPKKKILHDKISLQINMTMKVTTFSAVLLIFTCRPIFIHPITILPEKNCKHLWNIYYRKLPDDTQSKCTIIRWNIFHLSNKRSYTSVLSRGTLMGFDSIQTMYFCPHSSFPIRYKSRVLA